MEVRVRIIVDVLSSACATPVRVGSLSLGSKPNSIQFAFSVMVAQTVFIVSERFDSAAQKSLDRWVSG